MDPTTLRIILIIVGLASLLALYLWERQRGQRGGAVRRKPARPVPAKTIAYRREPSLETMAPKRGVVQDMEPQPETSQPLRAAENLGTPATAAVSEAGSQNHAKSKPEESDARNHALDIEPLLIQIFIIAREGQFLGPDILRQARSLGLEAGDMDIFHRYTPAGALQDPLYSMANLVKPGSFPFDAMQAFHTPGLALFSELRGEPSDLMVFDELLSAAHQLSEQLNGELRGADRERLDEGSQQALRNQVSKALERAEAHRLG